LIYFYGTTGGTLRKSHYFYLWCYWNHACSCWEKHNSKSL